MPTIFPLEADERARERALRARFAQYWSTARGEPRTLFDTFIASSTPVAGGVSFERVETAKVNGWWSTPTTPVSRGVILHLHGGGYVQGSARAFRGFASQIASRTRHRVFSLDYPLAPEATLPAAPDAAMAAYEWLRSNGGDIPIAVVGDSAGGGLVLATLMRLPREAQAVAGVLFSPWVDLAFTGHSMHSSTVEDPLITYEHLHDYADKYLGPSDAHDPLASPLYGDLSHLPPLLIQVGTDERLLDDARQLATRAERAGARVRLEVWQGMHHVFQLNVDDLQTSRVALDRASGFLVEQLRER